MYIIHEDEQGQLFADALLRKAAEGVQVRLLYDWMGGFRKTSTRFWNRLRGGGIDVRCHNPPRFDRPLAWLSRDHRKTITVDSTIAFVTGLCVGRMWMGDPSRSIDPWRDTGIELRGPAAGAVRVGNAVTAAVANTRVLESVESNIALIAGAILAAIAALAFKYPRGIAYPIGVFAAWFAAAILYRGIELYRDRRRTVNATPDRNRSHETRSVSSVERNPGSPSK